MGRNRSLFNNSIFFAIGNLGSKVVQLLMLPLYTKWLSPADYGVVDLLNNYINVLILFIGLDVADALIVFPLKKKNEEIKTIFSTALVFTVLTTLVALILFLLLHITGFNSAIGAFGENLWYAFGILISQAIYRVFQYFCRGINKMSVFSYTGVVSSLLIAAFSFLLIPKFGFRGYLLAMILSNILTAVFVIVYSKAFDYFLIDGYDKGLLRQMLRYSVPMIPNILLWWIILSLNRPLLEKYTGLAAIGIFGIACKIPDLIGMVYNFFHSAWITTISEEYGNSDFNKYVNQVLEMITCVQTFIYLATLLLSKYLFQWFIDVRYSEALMYVPILCVGIVLSNFATFMSSIFNANRKTYRMFYSVIIAAGICLLLNFALIPKYGIWGACISIVVGHLTAGVSRLYFARDSFKLIRPYHLFLNITLCVVCALLYFYDLHSWLVWLILLLFSVAVNSTQVQGGAKMVIEYSKNRKINKRKL